MYYYSTINNFKSESYQNSELVKIVSPLYLEGGPSPHIILDAESLPLLILFNVQQHYCDLLINQTNHKDWVRWINNIDKDLSKLNDPKVTYHKYQEYPIYNYHPNTGIERVIIWGCIYYSLATKSEKELDLDYIRRVCTGDLDDYSIEKQIMDYFIDEAYKVNQKNPFLKQINEQADKIAQLEKEIANNNGNEEISGKYKVTDNKKTDFIKIISAMYELRLFSTIDGEIASNKQELMNEFGKFLNEDFKDYSKALSQAKNSSNFLDVFDRLKEKADNYYNK